MQIGPLMFERYTEKARRLIFYGRFEASAFGSPEISTAHLLLGLLREGSELLDPLLQTGDSIETLRNAVVVKQPRATVQVSTSVDLPLSHHAKRVLAYASEESEWLEYPHIDLVHLLLGLLRDPTVSDIVIAHGITRDKVLTHVMTPPAADDAGARFRVFELVRTFPPELLAQAEQALLAVLTLHDGARDAGNDDSDTQQRSIRVVDTGTVVETSRQFDDSEVVIT